MRSKTEILEISGEKWALEGLSLSYGKDPGQMRPVAQKLKDKGNGENKFLESIVVWLRMTFPRYFWQQFDTYRVGVSKQSESTMHTLTKRMLTIDDFVDGIDEKMVEKINEFIAKKDWKAAKINLPEGFMQTRIVCANVKSLKNMVYQRKTHRLSEWHDFIEVVEKNVPYIK